MLLWPSTDIQICQSISGLLTPSAFVRKSQLPWALQPRRGSAEPQNRQRKPSVSLMFCNVNWTLHFTQNGQLWIMWCTTGFSIGHYSHDHRNSQRNPAEPSPTIVLQDLQQKVSVTVQKHLNEEKAWINDPESTSGAVSSFGFPSTVSAHSTSSSPWHRIFSLPIERPGNFKEKKKRNNNKKRQNNLLQCFQLWFSP